MPSVVQVTVHDALLHRAEEWMDPFVRIALDTGPLQTERASSCSAVDVDGGKNPRWEDRLLLPLKSGCVLTPVIRLGVFHEQTLLGEALLPLSKSVANEGHLVHCKLSLGNVSFEKTGEITISVQVVPDEPAVVPCQIHVAFAIGLPTSDGLASCVSLCVQEREICRTCGMSGTAPVWNEKLLTWVEAGAIVATQSIQVKVYAEDAIVSTGDVLLPEESVNKIKAGDVERLAVAVELNHGILHMELVLGGPMPKVPEAVRHILRVTLTNVTSKGIALEQCRIHAKTATSSGKSETLSAISPGTFVWEPKNLVVPCEKLSFEAITSSGVAIRLSNDMVDTKALVLPTVAYDVVELTVSGYRSRDVCSVQFNIPAVRSESTINAEATTVKLRGRVYTAFQIRQGGWASLSANVKLNDPNGLSLGTAVIDLGKALAKRNIHRTHVQLEGSGNQEPVTLNISVKGFNDDLKARNDQLREIEELKALFYKLDVDRNGRVDVEEFKRVGIEQPPLANFDFAVLDANHDGVLQWKEFEQIITRYHRKDDNLRASKEECASGILSRGEDKSSSEVARLLQQLEEKESELKSVKLAKKFLEQQGVKARMKHNRKGLWKRAIALAQRDRHQAEISAFKRLLEDQSSAASKLQAAYRSAQPRKAFLAHQASRRSGALVIQRVVRAKQAFSKLRRDCVERNSAATRLQRVYRGIHIKRDFLRQRQGATDIQRVFRGSRDRTRVNKVKIRNLAARKLQAFYRYCAANKMLFSLKIQREEENAAALTLQQSFRSHRAKEELMVKRAEAKEMAKEDAAAVALQRVLRGAHVRATLVKSLQMTFKRRDLAAIRIQSKAREQIARRVIAGKRLLKVEERGFTQLHNHNGNPECEDAASRKSHSKAELVGLLEEELAALTQLAGGFEGRGDISVIKRAGKGVVVGDRGQERLLQLLSRIKGLDS